jgi:hypothetical protein
MNLSYKHLIPDNFHPDSKVWIYQSDRPFNVEETIMINLVLEEFTSDWKSHGANVKGFGQLFFQQFIIIMADENFASVSGCSTDSSVRIIKSIEEKTKANLFNRQNLAFYLNDNIQIIGLYELQKRLETAEITAETLYFNNTILTKKEFEEKWLIPLKNSWLKTKLLLPFLK